MFAFPKIGERNGRYEFVENQDFVKLPKIGELSKAGQMTIEYFVVFAKIGEN